jgi:hypothetical protein
MPHTTYFSSILKYHVQLHTVDGYHTEDMVTVVFGRVALQELLYSASVIDFILRFCF